MQKHRNTNTHTNSDQYSIVEWKEQEQQFVLDVELNSAILNEMKIIFYLLETKEL